MLRHGARLGSNPVPVTEAGASVLAHAGREARSAAENALDAISAILDTEMH